MYTSAVLPAASAAALRTSRISSQEWGLSCHKDSYAESSNPDVRRHEHNKKLLWCRSVFLARYNKIPVMIMSVASGPGLSVWFAESRRSNVSHESTAVNADILCFV